MEEVAYHLKLNKDFDGPMREAKEHADALEHSMGHLKEVVLEFIGIYAGMEVIKESVADARAAAVANSQLEASLKSTAGAAGLAKEQLEEQSEALMKHSLFSKTAETNMQALLLTFTSVKGEVFESASEAINNMAQKMGGGPDSLKETSIQVGKALQDPIHGIVALHRVGVNFSEAQKEQIKHLVETNHQMEAQKLILNELNTEFGGSAQAAADADPVGKLSQEFEEARVEIGKFIIEGLQAIQPYLESFFEGIKEGIKWLKEHKEMIKVVISALIAAGSAYVIVNGALKLNAWYNGMSTAAIILNTAATEGMEAAQVALNLAMEENPIGLLITGVAALTAGMVALIDSYQEADELMKKSTQDFGAQKVDEERQAVLKLAAAYEAKGFSEKKAREMALSEEGKAVDERIRYLQNIVNSDISSAIEAQETSTPLTGAQAKQQAINKAALDAAKAQKALLGDKTIFDKTTNVGKVENVLNQSDKVTGTKQVTINVSIQKLVEMIKIESQNIKDGATMGAEHVTRALIASVNQFQASIDT